MSRVRARARRTFRHAAGFVASNQLGFALEPHSGTGELLGGLASPNRPTPWMLFTTCGIIIPDSATGGRFISYDSVVRAVAPPKDSEPVLTLSLADGDILRLLVPTGRDRFADVYLVAQFLSRAPSDLAADQRSSIEPTEPSRDSGNLRVRRPAGKGTRESSRTSRRSGKGTQRARRRRVRLKDVS